MNDERAFSFHPKLDTPSLQSFYQGHLAYAVEMFDAFLTHGPLAAQKLERCWRAGDREGLASTLHQLQPGLAMVGLQELARQADDLRERIRGGDELQALAKDRQRLLAALATHLPLIREECRRMQCALDN